MSNPSPTGSSTSAGPAPADARPHAKWPLWKVLLAYATLACLAAAAIWYIDLRAHRPPALRPTGMPSTSPTMSTKPADAGDAR